MQRSVQNKAGSAKDRTDLHIVPATGKDHANSTEAVHRFEMLFDMDNHLWYCMDTVTGSTIECKDRKDCEVEVAIRECEHIRFQILEKRQQRLFR
jgi:hypothetical protein